MKVFRFHPSTGRRGEQIDTRKRADWTGPYIPAEYLYSENLPTPQGFGPDADVGIHTDAGIGLIGDEVSYIHEYEWITFCLGEFRTGPDEGRWNWVILPPLSARRTVGEVQRTGGAA